jgi:protein tyrosine/serine phosphatase
MPDRTLTRWLDLDGVVNARDVGGLPLADGGQLASGRLLRSDNLQDLSDDDVRTLVDDLGLHTVIDLRTGAELQLEGPGPLAGVDTVRIEHRSLYPETGGRTDIDAETALPWTLEAPPEDQGETPTVQVYLAYLRRRPDSVVEALRAIARAQDGAVLVHCAAGKDRTGVVVALALELAGVERGAIVEDYLATGERIGAIVERLASSSTYAGEMRRHDPQTHAPRQGTMERVLELVDERHGGAAAWLSGHGFGPDEQAALRARLRD